jgi:hypothetical protein
MIMPARTLLLVGCFALTACGGRLETGTIHDDETATTDRPRGDTPSSSPSTPSDPAAPPAGTSATTSTAGLRDPACAVQPGRRVFHTTMSEVRAAIQGKWVLCSEKGLTHEAQAGVEFEGDRWHLLKVGVSGLEPVYGVMNEGALQLIDTSVMNGTPSIQANFVYDRGGTVISQPVFSTGPEGMLINNNGVYSYYYVRPTK